MVDFTILEEILNETNAGIRAAECHGFICAVLCVSGEIKEDVIQKYLLVDELENEMQESYAVIADVVTDTTSQLHSLDMDLQLLLPDDDNSLETRGIALTEWCQGFLSGLGVGGLHDTNILPESCKALIEDLYKISRLQTENLDEQGEMGEQDLMELIEYVRMGTIHLYDECHTGLFSIDNPDGILH